MQKIMLSRQETQFNCGPACLQMILACFGKRVSQKKLAAMAKTTKKHGTKPKNLVRALGLFCIKAKAKKASPGMLRAWLKQGNLAIVDYFLEKEQESHFAVVAAVGKKRISLCDPWAGKKQYYIIDFCSVWFDNLNKNKNIAIFVCAEGAAKHD